MGVVSFWENLSQYRPGRPRLFKPEELAGKTVGNFKIERKIGQGGMAHVYLARDTAHNRLVALKVLDAVRAGNSRFVARFEREARIALKLKHPNIVTVYDVLKTQGLYFIVMEYMAGQGLDEVLQNARQRGETLDPAYTIAVIRQVAGALDYAHQNHKVVHRDVKPANILVMPNLLVKLTDFGIARALEEDSDLTADNTYVGTPFYMSPEHFTGGKVDHRSDIYSLGVVLYQMMVNVLGPFGDTDPSLSTLGYNHAHVKPLPPHQLNPDIKPGVEKVILKALEKEPDKRYQTGYELAEGLATAHSAGAVSSSFPRWLLAGVGGLAILFILLLALVAFLVLRPGPPSVADAGPAPTDVTVPVTAAANQPLSVALPGETALRAGPGDEYDLLITLPPGSMLTLNSVNPDGAWVKVETPDSGVGWLPVTALELGSDALAAVPVAILIPPTPTAALPVAMATEAASASDALPTPPPTVEPSPTRPADPTRAPTATRAASPTPSSGQSGGPSRRTTARPAIVAYVQSNGDTHRLGLVSSASEPLNGNLHEYAAAPAWSPDGQRLAFFGKEGISQLSGPYSAGSGLWILDSNAPTQPARLLRGEDHIKNIAWSPDGTKIAYEVVPPGFVATIVVVDAGDGAEISRFPGAQPAWSPDSSQLFIRTCAPDCGLWLVGVDGGNARQQTFDASDSYPSWTAGDRVAFCSNRDNDWEIYILTLSDGTLERITSRPGTDITPVFSPDGQEIYLRTDHFGGWRVTALTVNGGNERTVQEGVGESTDWGLARPAVN
jgi:hypothetical protein